MLAREPLPTRKLAMLADLADGTEARRLIRLLAGKLRSRSSATYPYELAGGVQLLTRPELADWIGRCHGSGDEVRLSGPALETLAVVAYRQPVTRAEVEAIRGVQCGEVLRLLMERDLLRIVGRSEELGRPFLYGPTRKFLQVFGLRRLEQLPSADQIRIAK
jgi:segregation and condensation protein B